MSHETYYYLKDDVTIVTLDDGNILLKSDYVSARVDGPSANFFSKNIIPLLDGDRSFVEIAASVNSISEESLQKNLDSLVDSGVLVKSQQKKDHHNSFPQTFSNLLRNFQLDQAEVFKAISSTKLLMVGLNPLGIHLTRSLIQIGIGEITLIDPNSLNDEVFYHFVDLKQFGENCRRDKATSEWLKPICWNTRLNIADGNFTKEDILNSAQGRHLMIVDVNKGLTAANYWVNEISLEYKIPAIYSEIKGHTCLVGPLVVPEETPCFMCYKMRSLACDENFKEAISYEKYYNDLKKEAPEKTSALPTLPSLAASLILNETLKFILGIKLNSVGGKILEFDAFSLAQSIHPIVHEPNCPACLKKKDKPRRSHRTIDEILNARQPIGDLLKLKEALCDTKTGIIKNIERFQKDISEPELPYIYRADLSNHNFQSDNPEIFETCSGKGFTHEAAQISALGEAIERYSGASVLKDEIIYSNYNDLTGTKLHPSSLVLYDQSQYGRIDFVPFDPAHEMGWVNGYSLVNSRPVKIPALAVFMNYHPKYAHEFLFQATSNGLAAGKTLANSIVSGALEVIERDAFLISWHNRLSSIRIDPFDHPDPEVVEYCTSYRRRGVEMNLFILPTDTPCKVCLAVGFQTKGDGPAACVGLGASFDLKIAAKHALLEVGQVRPALRRRIRNPETKKRLVDILANPNLVQELSDHDLFYSAKTTLKVFDFLLDQSTSTHDWNEPSFTTNDQLLKLISYLSGDNNDLIYYNLTPGDMEPLGLYTTRVIIPDFQPIHFGLNNIRLGGRRMFELPYKLGINPAPSTIESINTNPHPLA